MNHRRTRASSDAFTLIELLVVIAIIGVLAALIFPAIGNVMENGKRSKCASNARQIALAAEMLFQQDKRYLPNMGADATDFGRAAGLLLTYVGDSTAVFDCPSNKGLRREPELLITGYADKYTEYEINGFLASVTGLNRPLSGITDPSRAAYAYDFPWFDNDRAHRDGINVGYLDGHAGWLQATDFGSGSNAFYMLGHTFQ